MPSNTKSNKLSRLHLTLTEMALSTSILATQGMVEFFKLDHLQSLDLHSMAPNTSSLFSKVASGIQCVKSIINELGVDLYRVEKHP